MEKILYLLIVSRLVLGSRADEIYTNEIHQGYLDFGDLNKYGPFENMFEKLLQPVDKFLEDILPPFLGLRPNNAYGTKEEWKHLAIVDNINDDAVYLSIVS